jgi:hypothetical protein
MSTGLQERAPMTHLKLDWSTAEVQSGTLTVSLDGKPSDQWEASFERTAHLLDRGTWPEIKLGKRKIEVKGVEEGSEERLRFFLESVVQEANAEQGEDEEESKRDGEPESAEETSETEQETNPDREMTDRFRSFAGSEDEESDDA